jgi:hypothetical protein
MAQLPKGAETSISKAFLVMYLEKILRLLRLLFVLVFSWFYTWQRPGFIWLTYRNAFQLEIYQSLISLHSHASKQPAPTRCWLGPLITLMHGLASFELPPECIFEGSCQLALKLDDASGIWERHRIQIEHLAKEVKQSYSINHATSLLDHHLGYN